MIYERILLAGACIVIGITARVTHEPRFVGSSVLDEVPLIDGHNDLPHTLKSFEHNILHNFTFDTDLRLNSKWTQNETHTDLPRLRRGKVGAQFWVAYVSCKSKDAVGMTLEQIDTIKRIVAQNSNDMRLVTTADGIMDAFRDKKIASLVCVEGGHSIDSRMAVLRLYYELGVRYLTLTHTCNTPWADQSGMDDAGQENSVKVGGLSEWGKNLVLEMNRLGMMVDLSHVSKAVMFDALAVSKAPVIFSHSSAYTVHPHTRNVQDDVLQSVKTNNGIVMVNFYTGFLTSNAQSTIDDVIAHLDHIRTQIGADHIGIGGDYNGVDTVPNELEDVSKYPILFDELAVRGWTRTELRKLAGENLLRVYKQVEAVRDSLVGELPYDIPIPRADLLATGESFACRTDFNV